MKQLSFDFATEASRPSWDVYLMGIAKAVSARGSCPRLKVGAVAAHDSHRVLATGYNGSPPGAPHCEDVGCAMEHGHCKRAVHAETNAVTAAARFGVSLDGATMYVTAAPCMDCMKVMISAGISRVVYGKEYRNTDVRSFGEAHGVEVTFLEE